MAATLVDGFSNRPPSKAAENFSLINNTMATGIRWKKGWMCILCAAVVLLLMVYLISVTSKSFGGVGNFAIKDTRETEESTRHTNWFWTHGYSVWPEFSIKPLITNDHFRHKCVTTSSFSITTLPNISSEWQRSSDSQCMNLYKKFGAIFTVDARKAHVSIPSTFAVKVGRWLGNKQDLMKELYNQDVIHIISKFTREHTIFNPLRDKRPVLPPDIPEQKYVDDIVNKTRDTCDFCKFKQMTAEHLFGRIESKHSFTASNVFKIDTLHALVGLKSHHPLKWNKEQFLDVMGLTVTWLKKAKQHHQPAKFASLIWDMLPKCGASQVHPHVQVMFDPSRYHGSVESWRQGAQDYSNNFGGNYFTDLVNVYSALGLTVTHGNATAFASLVPRKDHEVVVMAKEANAEFFTLLYYTLRAFIDDLHVFCYSMGIGYPAFGSQEGKIPAYARIITRGAVTDIRADISSLELFTATNVNIDPWKTIQLVRDSVKKRSGI